MSLKGKSISLICFVAIILITTWIIHRRVSHPISIETTHIIAINKLLYGLRKECIVQNIGAAQNTMEDLKLEWEYLDLIVPKERHYTSRSLKTLDSLVNLMSEEDQFKRQLPNVLKEINVVNESLDRIH